jgi:hypothetical protein
MHTYIHRDANKLRLSAELCDEAIKNDKVLNDASFPYWPSPGTPLTPAQYIEKYKLENNAASRLKWMLQETMGSEGAFDRRRLELQILRNGAEVSDEDVVKSYVESVDPSAGDKVCLYVYMYVLFLCICAQILPNGAGVSDEDVVKSYAESVRPSAGDKVCLCVYMYVVCLL